MLDMFLKSMIFLKPGVVQAIAVFCRGKSGLHRAGRRITSGGGDSKESATEKKPPAFAGKGGMAV